MLTYDMRNGPYELVVAPPDYPGKRYRGRYCYEHHLVFWREHGIVPGRGQVVHHSNHNKRDNRPSNLFLKTHKQHGEEHATGVTMVTLTCPECGVGFDRARNQTHLVKPGQSATYCGRQCSGRGSCR